MVEIAAQSDEPALQPAVMRPEGESGRPGARLAIVGRAGLRRPSPV